MIDAGRFGGSRTVPHSIVGRVPGDSDIASIARLLGQPSRATMCMALLSGQALTATELARLAGVSKATASEHLQSLIAGGLLTVLIQGRHRYYRLAGPQVAEVLEGLARIAPRLPVRTLRQSTTAAALADARTCYDHIAGRLGVTLYDRMLATDAITHHQGELVLGVNIQLYDRLGLDLGHLQPRRHHHRRPQLRECQDWTERRPHLAGSLAADLLTTMLTAGWITRTSRPRALTLTTPGRQFLTELGLLDQDEPTRSQAPQPDTPAHTQLAV